MRKASIIFGGIVLLINAGITFAADPNVTLEWKSGQTQGNWQILTSELKINKRIVIAGPTKTFDNQCKGHLSIPFTPVVSIDNTNKIVKLVFAGPMPGSCDTQDDPVYAYITVELGPLTEGQWRFQTWPATMDICNYDTLFTVRCYSGGDGSETNPWQISDKIDLLALGTMTSHYTKNFIMTADVNLAGETYSTALIAPDKAPYFTGVFDGNGFTISGLTIDGRDNNYYLGLFGKINKGQIKNLGLEEVSISRGRDYVGGLAGNNGGTISNCYCKGSISGQRTIGGLVGHNAANISNCNTEVSVSGSEIIGGLAGSNVAGAAGSGNIKNCCSSGQINGIANDIGGLVGFNNSGSISDSDSNCLVVGNNNVGGVAGSNTLGTGNISDCNSRCSINGNENVGGIVGNNVRKISDCHSTCAVNGNFRVGGLVGCNSQLGDITDSDSNCTVQGSGREVGGLVGNFDTYENGLLNCHSTGTVEGKDQSVGGLVGYAKCKISGCYSTCDVKGTRYVGGLVGYVYPGNNSISNSYYSGDVRGETDYVGGLVGLASCQITNCHSSGFVFGGGTYVGGLAGAGWNISNSYSTAKTIGNDTVGGLAGSIENSNSFLYSLINKCYSTGDVSAKNNNAGGLIGNLTGSMSDCYTSGAVSGNWYVGGLVGKMGGNTISNCYSIRDISGKNYLGGLIGSFGCEIKNCFWDIELQTHGVTESIGNITDLRDIIIVAGLTTSQMQKKSTYITLPSEWDFVHVWDIGENQTYPYFRQYLAGDIDLDNIVDYKDLALLAENWLTNY